MNEGLLRAGFQMTACLPDTIGQSNRTCRVIPWESRILDGRWRIFYLSDTAKRRVSWSAPRTLLKWWNEPPLADGKGTYYPENARSVHLEISHLQGEMLCALLE
jgi:hypothetical protein